MNRIRRYTTQAVQKRAAELLQGNEVLPEAVRAAQAVATSVKAAEGIRGSIPGATGHTGAAGLAEPEVQMLRDATKAPALTGQEARNILGSVDDVHAVIDWAVGKRELPPVGTLARLFTPQLVSRGVYELALFAAPSAELDQMRHAYFASALSDPEGTNPSSKPANQEQVDAALALLQSLGSNSHLIAQADAQSALATAATLTESPAFNPEAPAWAAPDARKLAHLLDSTSPLSAMPMRDVIFTLESLLAAEAQHAFANTGPAILANIAERTSEVTPVQVSTVLAAVRAFPGAEATDLAWALCHEVRHRCHDFSLTELADLASTSAACGLDALVPRFWEAAEVNFALQYERNVPSDVYGDYAGAVVQMCQATAASGLGGSMFLRWAAGMVAEHADKFSTEQARGVLSLAKVAGVDVAAAETSVRAAEGRRTRIAGDR